MTNPAKQSIYNQLEDMSRKAIDQMTTQERWQKLARLLAIELRRQLNENSNEEKEVQNGHGINAVQEMGTLVGEKEC